MNASHEQSPGNRIQAFDVHFGELEITLIDPDSPAEFRQKLGLFHMRHEARPRLAVDYPSLASAYKFRSHELKVVGICYFENELAILFATFLLFFLAFLAFVF